MKTSLRISLIAAAFAALPLGADAAGLGRLNVYSGLGQPLRAEVEVTGTAEELDALSARIASADAFRRANIDYSPYVAQLRVSTERKGSGAVLRLSTEQPVNEPFMDFLLELNWAGGRLVREYTFLLDPVSDPTAAKPDAKSIAPTITAPANKSSAKSKKRAGKSARPAGDSAAAVPPATTEKPATPAAPAAETVQPGENYTVKSGDTLSRIASSMRGDASLEQALVALYSANKEQFPSGNINRIRTGQVLQVPGAESLQAQTRPEARKTLAMLSANFEAYRQKMASAAAGAPAKESAAQQSSAGKITAKVEDAAKPSESKDQLKISKTQMAKDRASTAQSSRIQALEEDLAARERAVKEANSRVSELERNVKELQKLVEMKSDSLAALQKQVAAPVASPSAAPTPVAVQTPLPEQAPVAAEPSPAVITEPLPLQSEPLPPIDPPVEASAPSAPPPEVPAVTTPTPAPVAQATPPAPEAAWYESLLGNKLALAGLAVVAVLGGLLYYRSRKSRGPSVDTTAMSATQTSNESVIGPAGGQTVDTGSSVLPTDFSQSGLTSIDADEGVDPVAEADVYMAYGRDAQAEEILLDALKSDPSRTAIHAKLLEIYSQRKSVKQFENIATDLYTQTGGVGPEWAKAAQLGLQIDEYNPLYKAASAAPAAAEPEPALLEELSFVEPDLDGVAEPVLPALEPELRKSPKAPVTAAAATAGVAAAVQAEQNFGGNSATAMQATWTMPGEIAQLGRADAASAVIEEPQVDDLGLDFNLDLDVAPAGPARSASKAAPPLAELDELAPLELDGLSHAEEAQLLSTNVGQQRPGNLTFDLDMGSGEDLGVSSSKVGDTESLVDLEKTNFDGSLLDFDFDDSSSTAGKPADRAVDLSRIDLDLPAPAAASAAATASTAPRQAELETHPEPQLLDEELDVGEEVTTKLELARAYEEMRDFEGARELLEEVMSDGSSAQKREAEAILARLA